MDNYIDLLFTVPPGPNSEFIEAENTTKESISVGEWIGPEDSGDQYWRLRIRPEVFNR